MNTTHRRSQDARVVSELAPLQETIVWVEMTLTIGDPSVEHTGGTHGPMSISDYRVTYTYTSTGPLDQISARQVVTEVTRGWHRVNDLAWHQANPVTEAQCLDPASHLDDAISAMELAANTTLAELR